jgi:hypothetical protein
MVCPKPSVFRFSRSADLCTYTVVVRNFESIRGQRCVRQGLKKRNTAHRLYLVPGTCTYTFSARFGFVYHSCVEDPITADEGARGMLLSYWSTV